MIVIKKVKSNEVYETYKAVTGGAGTYISTVGFMVPVGASAKNIATTLLTILGLGKRFKIM